MFHRFSLNFQTKHSIYKHLGFISAGDNAVITLASFTAVKEEPLVRIIHGGTSVLARGADLGTQLLVNWLIG